jgi:hypothetical protein
VFRRVMPIGSGNALRPPAERLAVPEHLGTVTIND